jgi:hypothetical protein
LSAASDHIACLISSTLADRYQVINCIGFLPAIVAGIVIALQYFKPYALIVGAVISALNASPESQGDAVHRKRQRIYVLCI